MKITTELKLIIKKEEILFIDSHNQRKSVAIVGSLPDYCEYYGGEGKGNEYHYEETIKYQGSERKVISSKELEEVPVLVNGILSSIIYDENGSQLKMGKLHRESIESKLLKDANDHYYKENRYYLYSYGFEFCGHKYFGSRDERNKILLELFNMDLEHPDVCLNIDMENLPEIPGSLSFEINDFTKTEEKQKKIK